MPVYSSLQQLVGATPLLELKSIQKELNLNARILAKLECFNPGGSVKDRVALQMILSAREKGLLPEGGTIIEPTSGNTGIGLAWVASSMGYKAIIVMPDSMSIERIKLMEAFGAQVVLTAGKDGMSGAIAKANELAKAIPGSIIAGQFENPANPQAHYLTTGPEIWQDTAGKLDIFVAGVGTGGTITGTSRYLKEQDPNIQTVAIEPAASPLLTQGKAGPHGLQGIGANFVPGILDRTVIDDILTVTEEEAFSAARLLARKEGILCGISSGAALHGAIKLTKDEKNAGKTIVVLLPDSGERYLSTNLFA